MRAWTQLVTCLALVACSDGAHAAAHTVSILGISGPGGDRFVDLLEQDLADVYEVIPGDVYLAAAARLDRRSAAPEDVQAVARSLRIDAIVGGAISGIGRARTLALAVREGASGRVVARARYELGQQTLPQVRERVVSDLVRAFERVRPTRTPMAETPPQTHEPEFEPKVDETQAEVIPERAKRSSVAAPPRGVSAGVGITLLSRRLSFDLPSAPGYRGGAVAAIRAAGSVFPLALSSELAEAHPVLASFGLAGSYEHAFGFSSSNGLTAITGHASRWSALFLGRIPLGRGARGGELTLETGVQELSWSSDSPADLGVPDAKYDLVDAGLRWQRRLGTPLVELALRAAFLGLVSSSGISSDDQYGHATGWGIEAEAALVMRPKRWLWLGLEGRYTPVVLSFAANGARYARHGTEQWASGLLEVGFAL